jgi:hypothetical protein
MDPNKKNEAIMKSIKKSIPMSSIAVLVGLTIGVLQYPQLLRNPMLIALLLGISALALGLGFFLGGVLRGKNYDRVSIEIDQNQINIKNDGQTYFTIKREELVKIEKNFTGAITISTTVKPNKITLSKSFQDYQKLEQELSQLSPIITSDTKPANENLRIILPSLLTLACYALVKLAGNPQVILIAGILFAVTLTLCLVLIWKNKLVDKIVKILSLVAIFPIVDVLIQIAKVFFD